MLLPSPPLITLFIMLQFSQHSNVTKSPVVGIMMLDRTTRIEIITIIANTWKPFWGFYSTKIYVEYLCRMSLSKIYAEGPKQTVTIELWAILCPICKILYCTTIDVQLREVQHFVGKVKPCVCRQNKECSRSIVFCHSDLASHQYKHDLFQVYILQNTLDFCWHYWVRV